MTRSGSWIQEDQTINMNIILLPLTESRCWLTIYCSTNSTTRVIWRIWGRVSIMLAKGVEMMKWVYNNFDIIIIETYSPEMHSSAFCNNEIWTNSDSFVRLLILSYSNNTFVFLYLRCVYTLMQTRFPVKQKPEGNGWKIGDHTLLWHLLETMWSAVCWDHTSPCWGCISLHLPPPVLGRNNPISLGLRLTLQRSPTFILFLQWLMCPRKVPDTIKTEKLEKGNIYYFVQNISSYQYM